MVKNKRILLLALLCSLAAPVHANVDQVFGKKATRWTSAYDEFMSFLGIRKSYAIVIGISQYNDKTFDSLPSEKDAVRMKNYLVNEAGFDHVRLITGEKVTVAKVREYMLDYYPKKLKKNDRFLFYWSGHGVTEGRKGRKFGYFALKESSKSMFSSMLSMTNLSQWDRRIKAKQTLYLLDSCFSGIAASRAMSSRKEQTMKRVNRPSRQVLTAGLENERTVAINDLGGGVFTRAILDGLRGEADSDKGYFKKDGVVTVRELEEYVRERVDHERERVGWNEPITPQLHSFSVSAGDFFFVSDKQIVKSQALIQSRNTKVVATGVDIAKLRARNPQSKRKKSKETRIVTSGFIDHRNGTVTDIKTNLIWKRCSEGQRYQGNSCKGKAKRYTWDDAMNRFKGVSFSGRNDWRIPTEKELGSLVHCSNGIPQHEAWDNLCHGKNERGGNDYQMPTISLDAFPNTESYFYWSSSPFRGSIAIQAINFGWGNVMSFRKEYNHHVRLVRSGQ